MAAKPHFAASVQSKKGRLYAVMQVKKDGTTKPVWRALGLPEGANKTKVNKAFREVVAQYEQEFWEEQERGGRPPADIPVYDYLVSYLKRVEPEDSAKKQLTLEMAYNIIISALRVRRETQRYCRGVAQLG